MARGCIEKSPAKRRAALLAAKPAEDAIDQALQTALATTKRADVAAQLGDLSEHRLEVEAAASARRPASRCVQRGLPRVALNRGAAPAAQ
eukprot:8672289-Pyramimonas_sp.AAC.1